MAVTSRTTPVTIEELHTVLLTQEHRVSITSQMASLDLTSSSPLANLAARSTNSRGNGGSGRGRGQYHGRGRGRNNNHGSRGGTSSNSMSGFSQNIVK